VLTFNRISAGKRQKGQAFVPTWVFVGTYLLVWTFFGLLAYAVALAADWLAGQTPALADNAARIGGAILALGGLYQLSPLKRACLSKCRTPLSFILSSWREGYWGACRLGLSHGVYCLGCCWLLFVILFPLGVMNVAAMAVLTVLIYAEKSLPIAPRAAQLAAVGLIAYGVLV